MFSALISPGPPLSHDGLRNCLPMWRRLFRENGRLDLRYVIELDQRFFLIEFVEQQPRFTGFDGVIELFTHLSLPQQHSTHLVLDRHALVEKPRLGTVIQALDGQSIQVFYFAQDKLAEVYLVDERGSFLPTAAPFTVNPPCSPLWPGFLIPWRSAGRCGRIWMPSGQTGR